MGLSLVNLVNEAWSHGGAEHVQVARVYSRKLVGKHTIRSVVLGYYFLASVGPTLPNEGDSMKHLHVRLSIPLEMY
jgi:hypothetical protein